MTTHSQHELPALEEGKRTSLSPLSRRSFLRTGLTGAAAIGVATQVTAQSTQVQSYGL